MNRILSCDWGTSRFRLRLLDVHTKNIYSEVISDEGINDTHREWAETGRPGWERVNFYKSKLAESINRLPVGPDKNTPLIISGMASSSIGIKELPYSEFPFQRHFGHWVTEKIAADEKFSYPIILVSGFRTNSDIMRGEETMLLGCHIPAHEESLFIFPGTHSKHVFVKNKTGVDFKTFMTGELFALMSEKSILQHAVQKGIDEKAFADGIKAGCNGNLLHELFGIRSRQVLQQANPVSNYQWLSGLLIGTELREASRLKLPVYLVSGENLRKAYRDGLEIMGLQTFSLNADEMLINGHCKIALHHL
jgi:2-dehydro-3-deoxygalactonokinase